MSRTMSMTSPWMMIGPMITLGMFPFMLANLKYMVMNAFMINNMALMMALRTTVNNLVFGDSENDNIVYRNKGYSNEFPNRPANYGPGHGAPIVYRVKPWNRPSLAAPNAAEQFNTTKKHSVVHNSYDNRDTYGSHSYQSPVFSDSTNHRPVNQHQPPPTQEGMKVKYVAHHDYSGIGSDTKHKATPPVSVYRPSYVAGSRFKNRPPIPVSHVAGVKYQPNTEYLGSQSTNELKYPVRPIQDTTILYKQPDSNFFSHINHQIDAVNLGGFGYNQKTRFTDDNNFQIGAQSYIRDSYEPQEEAGGKAEWMPNNRKQDNTDWKITHQDQISSGHSKNSDTLKTGTEVGTVFPVYTAGEKGGFEGTSDDTVYPVRGESRYSEKHTPQVPVYQGNIGSGQDKGVIPSYSVGVGIDSSEKHKPQSSVYQGTIGSGQYAGSGRIPPYSVGFESDSSEKHSLQDAFQPVEIKNKYVGNHGLGTLQNFQVNPIVVPEAKPISIHQSQPNLNVPMHATGVETKITAGTAQNFQVSSGIRFGDPFEINEASTKLAPHRDPNPTQHHYVNREVMNVSPHDDEPTGHQYHAVDLNDENEFLNFPQQFVKTPPEEQSTDSNTINRRLGTIADGHQQKSSVTNHRKTPSDDGEHARVKISMTNDDRTVDKYPEPLAPFRDDYHS